MRYLTPSILCLLATATAQAQPPKFCPEGRMANGTCVDPRRAEDMRTTSIVLSQPKISMTGSLVLSDIDGDDTVPRDAFEIRQNHRAKGY